LPEGIDWITCSPKSAEHTLRLTHASEIKYVRNVGQGIPRPTIEADHQLISPAFRTMPDGKHESEPGALAWCLKLVKENPSWRLSVQQHKLWRVR
jgi:7-carboxy-7-deazaguanine synthase